MRRTQSKPSVRAPESVATEEPQLNQSLQEESVEYSSLNEPEGEEANSELAGKAEDKPFSRVALVVGVGFAVLMLAWTIMRTLSEGFGWPYYGWPYSG